MDLMPSAEQRDMRTALREFLAGTWTPDRLRSAINHGAINHGAINHGAANHGAANHGAANHGAANHGAADGAAFDHRAWKSLADLGVFAMTLAADDGGLGLGPADAVIVFEELGRALVPGPVTATFLAAGLVPGAADGDAVVSLVDTRDPVALVEHPAAVTDLLILDDAGVYRVPFQALSQEIQSRRDVPVPLDPLTPVAAVTVRPEDGLRLAGGPDAARLRLAGTLLTAALQVGVAQGALDLAVRYAGQRVQFGRPVGSFQAVKHLLADALARVDLARAATLMAGVVAADPASADLAGADARDAVAAAKVLADEAAAANGRTCVQVHGGMGFTWEVLAHLYVKRAWVLETAFGPADEHASYLAGSLTVDPSRPQRNS
jgi:alkylation response protein AidB-like acyl-CoA dehydrogenase